MIYNQFLQSATEGSQNTLFFFSSFCDGTFRIQNKEQEKKLTIVEGYTSLRFLVCRFCIAGANPSINLPDSLKLGVGKTARKYRGLLAFTVGNSAKVN